MINLAINKKNMELLKYFFSVKLDKIEYISFLKTLLNYFKEKMIFLDILDDISTDLYNIEQNSVNARYVVDKYILKTIK
jgi:hypothetical protein